MDKTAVHMTLRSHGSSTTSKCLPALLSMYITSLDSSCLYGNLSHLPLWNINTCLLIILAVANIHLSTPNCIVPHA